MSQPSRSPWRETADPRAKRRHRIEAMHRDMHHQKAAPAKYAATLEEWRERAGLYIHPADWRAKS